MSKTNDILLAAKARAEQSSLPYSGALTPDEAYELLQTVPGAKLVDVRSSAEWNFVGTVPGAVNIEWKRFPGMIDNPDFLSQLKQQVSAESLIMFLCRTGGRSDQAARLAAANGFTDCFNVLEGFEGDKDGEQHRGTVSGWKARKLPWIQS
ncbi:rhodanese-related sulfurtransferase [Chitinivorax tropicus]|uniref:Rhodanese-related sulfurtransferase n=1 Tax=Chitinivorax tropicus TaxID=714531 RepID=A0A840MLP2_9PROT|nr:rhodanese-like domain-containing protein [Chitinivorax tropicus]MBB5020074.1 rhodanese-related sulfurtransferase [Chitinivorax tropicus]